jgi:DNA-binding MurR/RpiR family transcriptional regulator
MFDSKRTEALSNRRRGPFGKGTLRPLNALGKPMEQAEGTGLHARLEAILGTGTPVERAIAAYLLNHIADLPFETAASLAARIRVSEVSIGRLARALDYRNLKEMKEALKAEADLKAIAAVSDSPWLKGVALAERFARSEGSKADGGTAALEREIHAVMRNHETAAGPEFARCARRLATVGHVQIAGFQTERGLAQYMAHNLSYLRPRVTSLALDSGHFAEVFLDDPANTALVIIETRRYSRLAYDLAKAARAQGIPVTLITDPYCGWATEVADEVLRVETDFNHYWDATGQIAGLINLLVDRIFGELGPGIEARLNAISRHYQQFVGHQR